MAFPAKTPVNGVIPVVIEWTAGPRCNDVVATCAWPDCTVDNDFYTDRGHWFCEYHEDELYFQVGRACEWYIEGKTQRGASPIISPPTEPAEEDPFVTTPWKRALVGDEGQEKEACEGQVDSSGTLDGVDPSWTVVQAQVEEEEEHKEDSVDQSDETSSEDTVQITPLPACLSSSPLPAVLTAHFSREEPSSSLFNGPALRPPTGFGPTPPSASPDNFRPPVSPRYPLRSRLPSPPLRTPPGSAPKIKYVIPPPPPLGYYWVPCSPSPRGAQRLELVRLF